MSISDEYKAVVTQIHKDHDWGAGAIRNFGDEIEKYLKRRGKIRTVLDYGSGQGMMEKHILSTVTDREFIWTNYDPGQPGIDKRINQDYDLIISSDVLEHVEPEEIDETIAWMHKWGRSQYHHIAASTTGLWLPDGRNAHLIIEGLEWWANKFEHPDWITMWKTENYKRHENSSPPFRRSVHINQEKISNLPHRRRR